MIHRHKQKGSVLIASLLILLVLTVVGVSGLSSTSLEERMSHNFEHSMLAFQAAESAIEKIIQSGDPGGIAPNQNPFYVEAQDPLLEALDAGIGVTSTVRQHDLDPYDKLKNTTLTTNSTISYQGARSLCPGYGSGVQCLRFESTTNATVASSNANTTHIQGLNRPAPAI